MFIFNNFISKRKNESSTNWLYFCASSSCSIPEAYISPFGRTDSESKIVVHSEQTADDRKQWRKNKREMKGDGRTFDRKTDSGRSGSERERWIVPR